MAQQPEGDMQQLPTYNPNPEVIAYIQADERYLRACAAFAEVLGVEPEVIERLALDRDFIRTHAKLAHAKAMLAVEWHQRNKAEAVAEGDFSMRGVNDA